ncbi:MAG: CRISPR-associated protein Cas5 [Isosphaeraceae bacterium]
MLSLYIQAPFAACRQFVAGWYRPTAGFLTYSTVYGLLLNVARIETRLWEQDAGHDGKTPATLARPDLPRFSLGLGLPPGIEPPRVESIYQQLHNYPVGSQSGTGPELARGRKNNITPVRRELLCDVQAIASVASEDQRFLAALRRGLNGQENSNRYGLPFLGDNNFLIDRIEEIDRQSVRWYTLIRENDRRPRVSTTRLTAHIGRDSMAETRSALFAPETQVSEQPPETAMVPVGCPEDFDRWLSGFEADSIAGQ